MSILSPFLLVLRNGGWFGMGLSARHPPTYRRGMFLWRFWSSPTATILSMGDSGTICDKKIVFQRNIVVLGVNNPHTREPLPIDGEQVKVGYQECE